MFIIIDCIKHIQGVHMNNYTFQGTFKLLMKLRLTANWNTGIGENTQLGNLIHTLDEKNKDNS